MAGMNQKQLIYMCIHIPVAAQRLMVQDVLRNVELPQLLLHTVIDVLVAQVVQDIPVVADAGPNGPDFQQSTEISQLQFAARWSMSRLSGSCKFSGAGCVETVVLPQLQLVEKICVPTCSCTWWSMSLLCGRAGRRLPFRIVETALHSPALSEDHRDSTVAVCCLVIDVPPPPPPGSDRFAFPFFQV